MLKWLRQKRINRLNKLLSIQLEYAEVLRGLSEEPNSGYIVFEKYTASCCKLIKLKSKLKFLEDKNL